MSAKLKIKKNDKVIVLTGKDKGRTGDVIKVFPTENRVLVSGVNVATRHEGPTQRDPGGLKKVESPIHVSNVALVDPKDGKATRAGYKTLKDGKKARISRRTGEVID